MRKNFLFKLSILSVLIMLLSYVISTTYSKYITKNDGDEGSYNIAKWNILINKQDMTKVSTIDVPLIDGANAEIAEDYIAPTYNGSFDLVLDTSNTDVPFYYKFRISDGSGTKSIYSTSVVHSWPGPTDGSKWYQLRVRFIERDLKLPVIEWDPFVERKAEMSLQVDPEKCTDVNTWSLDEFNFDHETGIITCKPFFWAWQWDPVEKINYFDTEFQILYTEEVVGNDAFFTDFTCNGKGLVDTLVPDFRITKYSLNDGPLIDVPDTVTSVAGIIYPEATGNSKNKFHFVLEWYDGPGEILDNQQDIYASRGEDFNGNPPDQSDANYYLEVHNGTVPVDTHVVQVSPSSPDFETPENLNGNILIKDENEIPIYTK